MKRKQNLKKHRRLQAIFIVIELFKCLLIFSMKPIIDIVQIFVSNDRLYNAVLELPEKANFISTITALMGTGKIDFLRSMS